MDEKEAYKLGRDCALNGANKKNCHFQIFTSAKYTEAWQKGKDEATNQSKEQADV